MSRSTSEALLSERASPAPPAADAWKRNVAAVTAASFMGYTGFTLAMPFLPLYIGQLGVADLGQVAMWTGVSLAVTPGLTALLAPAWGRLGDRYGRKIMVERSLVSFVVIMAAMAYVTAAWHVLALRIVQGLFAGYGSLSLTMAAESAPRERMPSAIGLVQTAQRLGPAIGPVIGGMLAHLVGLRRAFLVTAAFYAVALVCVVVLYDDRVTHAAPVDPADTGRVTFRNVLAFENFMLMMVAIFGLQFVDRSFGPVLPLYVEMKGTAHARVPVVSGILFSIMACSGALGHHLCGRLLRRFPARTVIAVSASAAGLGSLIFAVSGGPVPSVRSPLPSPCSRSTGSSRTGKGRSYACATARSTRSPAMHPTWSASSTTRSSRGWSGGSGTTAST